MTEGLAQRQSSCLVSICEAVVLSLHIKLNKESEYISFFSSKYFHEFWIGCFHVPRNNFTSFLYYKWI